MVALFFGAVNLAFHANRVPHIGIVKGDVVVAHQHQLRVRGQFGAHPVTQAFEPAHLVLKLVAAGLLPVGKVARNHPHIPHIGTDHARHVVTETGNVAHHVGHRRARQQGNAVVGFLAKGVRVVAGLTQRLERELVIRHLQFLQSEHVDRIGLQPVQHLRQTYG